MPRQYYTINEIFWSMQGEGIRAGEMSVFIRFTGCNLRCAMQAGPKSIGGFDCDTEFASGRGMSRQQIIDEAIKLVGKPKEWREEYRPWIVFTGGEPAMQLEAELVADFHAQAFRCAIETNGSLPIDELGLDWITVSPKVAEHAIRQLKADELKYVRGYGQGIPRPTCVADFKLISPAFNGNIIDASALEWCIQLIRENPEWRLSVQQHKAWQVR
jgi:organic radical activating enzyme